jgi:hypothetical protein
MTPTTAASQLLTAQDVSSLTENRIKPSTLAKWRSGQPGRRRRGPAYIKCGGRIVYRREDVETWLEANRIVPGASSKRKRS